MKGVRIIDEIVRLCGGAEPAVAVWHLMH